MGKQQSCFSLFHAVSKEELAILSQNLCSVPNPTETAFASICKHGGGESSISGTSSTKITENEASMAELQNMLCRSMCHGSNIQYVGITAQILCDTQTNRHGECFGRKKGSSNPKAALQQTRLCVWRLWNVRKLQLWGTTTHFLQKPQAGGNGTCEDGEIFHSWNRTSEKRAIQETRSYIKRKQNPRCVTRRRTCENNVQHWGWYKLACSWEDW